MSTSPRKMQKETCRSDLLLKNPPRKTKPTHFLRYNHIAKWGSHRCGLAPDFAPLRHEKNTAKNGFTLCGNVKFSCPLSDQTPRTDGEKFTVLHRMEPRFRETTEPEKTERKRAERRYITRPKRHRVGVFPPTVSGVFSRSPLDKCYFLW